MVYVLMFSCYVLMFSCWRLAKFSLLEPILVYSKSYSISLEFRRLRV